MDRLLEIALLNALMATGLAVLAAGLGRIIRKPAVRHALWLLVLLKLFTPPLWEWPVAWELPGQLATKPEPSVTQRDFTSPISTNLTTEIVSPPPLEHSVAEPELPSPTDTAVPLLVEQPSPDKPVPSTISSEMPRIGPVVSWKTIALAVWLAGTFLWFGLATVRLWRFRRLLSSADVAPSELQAEVARLASLLGLRRPPTMLFVPVPVPPMLLAVGLRAHLLVPRGLWSTLSSEQQETLLLHELTHLRRGDHWVRRLEFLARGLYFWHPVVWWASRALRDAEEECCDAGVVAARPTAREAYAATLIETVSFLSEKRAPLPLLASGVGHVRFLQRRLNMIMCARPSRNWSLLGAGAVLALAAVLPWQPVLAQPEAPPKPVPPPVAGEPPATPPVRNTPPTADPRPTSTGARTPTYGTAQDALEEVELLKVQLAAKQAELQEAKVLLNQSRRHVERISTLGNAVSTEERDQARTEVELREARLNVKEANVKEAALRLSQAERKANRIYVTFPVDSVTVPAPAYPPPRLPGAPGATSSPPPVSPATGAPDTTKRNTATAPTTPMVKPPPSGVTPPPAFVPSQGSDQRLQAVEAKLESLARELAALRQQLQPTSERKK
jgi:beta-lactamase regulating signal transducer with metallopeptidase domain